MIHVKNLHRKYGDVVAVKSLSFDVPKGQIVGLLGHNGAGKTTTLKMLTGYLEPSSGSVTINNINMQEKSRTAQVHLGYLPEQSPLYPEMTVVEYLDYVARLRGIKPKQGLKLIKEAMIATGLSHKAFSYIGTLSKGYKQRVGVAQAIFHKPQILILDEPTSGLDPSQILAMRSLIKDLSKTSTIIISTHIMQEVEAICDRVIILRQGKLALDSMLVNLKQDNYINITLDQPLDKLESLCKDFKDITKIEVSKQEGKYYSYKIYTPHNSIEEIIPNLARQICTKQWKLYNMNSEQQTLETIFNEVNKNHLGDSRHV